MLLQDLNDSMQAHLRLHFNNEEASDEQVCLFAHDPDWAKSRILSHAQGTAVKPAYMLRLLEVAAYTIVWSYCALALLRCLGAIVHLCLLRHGNSAFHAMKCREVRLSCESCETMQVLVIFPTTIRRRILRHLYLRQVRTAYLFKGVRQKFIDAILGVARIELFMPQARPRTLLQATQFFNHFPESS